MIEWQAREEICEIGRRVWQRQFVAANEGNISVRLNDNLFLVTPTMVSKGFMNPEDLIKVDSEGNVIEGRREPSSEILLHLQIYQERPDVSAVVHAHPPHSTAYAIVGAPIPKCIMPEVEILVGEIPMTEYATPGTKELAEKLKPHLKGNNTFLLANHGAVTLGRSLEEAYFRMEILDQYCRMLILAQQIGQYKQLGAPEIERLYGLRERLGLGAGGPRPCETCQACELGQATSTQAKTPTAPSEKEKEPAAPSVVSSTVIARIVKEVLSKLT